jgi:hypothetical protein
MRWVVIDVEAWALYDGIKRHSSNIILDGMLLKLYNNGNVVRITQEEKERYYSHPEEFYMEYIL